MKKQIISIIGFGTLNTVGCTQKITTNPPPTDNFSVNHISTKNNLPTWDAVKASSDEEKAELIVTTSGCFKNWVSAENTPKDRFEEQGKGIQIQCPERAKEITPQNKDTKEVNPHSIYINPPFPSKDFTK